LLISTVRAQTTDECGWCRIEHAMVRQDRQSILDEIASAQAELHIAELLQSMDETALASQQKIDASRELLARTAQLLKRRWATPPER
jgi:hypothetical protein